MRLEATLAQMLLQLLQQPRLAGAMAADDGAAVVLLLEALQQPWPRLARRQAEGHALRALGGKGVFASFHL